MTQPPVGNDGFGPTRFERATTGTQAAGQAGYDPARPPLVTGTAASVATAPPAGAPVALGAPGAPGANGQAPKPAAKSAPGRNSRARGPRRARLQLRNVNAWTVFRFSCVLAVFLFLVWIIVIMLLFGVLDAAGAVKSINDSVTTINGPGSHGVVTGGRVFVYGLIIGAVNAVLFIALATIGSIVYNLCADLVGGVEVTLSERDA
jgi:hypothetical protein